MRRDGRVGRGVSGPRARFRGQVELVNFAVAVVLVAASWVLVVQMLALWERHDRSEHHHL